MFTGIIKTIGTVVSLDENNSIRLRIKTTKKLKGVTVGSSLAVNGVCLTVNKINRATYTFDILRETGQKTNLLQLGAGDRVNLEPSLRVGDELGGHFVYGHVDGVGKIRCMTKIPPPTGGRLGGGLTITIVPPPTLKRYLVPQGAIAVNGASLTIAKLTKKDFTVSLVPFTLQETNLRDLQIGDRVNLECDMLAKYVFNLNSNKPFSLW